MSRVSKRWHSVPGRIGVRLILALALITVVSISFEIAFVHAGAASENSGSSVLDALQSGSLPNADSNPVSSVFTVNDTQPPAIGAIAPSGVIFKTSAVLTVYYSDDQSGIDSASAIVYLDGLPVDGCAATVSKVSCAVDGMVLGTHTISGSVADNAGNRASFDSIFYTAYDDTRPAFRAVYPHGVFSTTNGVMAGATLYDPGAGLDESTIVVYLDDVPMSGCVVAPMEPAMYGTQVNCPLGEVSEGTHYIVVKALDLCGNLGIGSTGFDFPVDSSPPTVDNLIPSGVIHTGQVWLHARTFDTGSGVDISTQAVYIDGNRLTGCGSSIYLDGTVYAGCPVSGLTFGDHEYRVSIMDKAGRLGSAAVTLTRVGTGVGRPDLRLSRLDVFWRSFADYQNADLTVMYAIQNAGAHPAYNVRVTGLRATNGVTASYPALPANMADIDVGRSATFTVTYRVPAGIMNFAANVEASAIDSTNAAFAYPAI